MSISATTTSKPTYLKLTKEQFLIAEQLQCAYKKRLIHPVIINDRVVHHHFYISKQREKLFLKVTVESGPQGICYHSDNPKVFSILTSRFQSVHHCVLSMLRGKDDFALVEEAKTSPLIQSALRIMDNLQEQNILLSTIQKIPQSKMKFVNGFIQVVFFNKSNCKSIVLNIKVKGKVEFFTDEQHKNSLAKIVQQFKTENDALVNILTNTNHFILLNWNDNKAFEILEDVAKLFESEREKIRFTQIKGGIAIEFKVRYTDINIIKVFKIEILDDGAIFLFDPQKQENVPFSSVQDAFISILKAIFKGLPNSPLLDFETSVSLSQPLEEEKKIAPVINLNKIDREQQEFVNCINDIYCHHPKKIKLAPGESGNWIVKIVISFEKDRKSSMFIFDIRDNAKFFMKEGDRLIVLSNYDLISFCKIMRGKDPKAILLNFGILCEFPQNPLPFIVDHFLQYPGAIEIFNVTKNLFNKNRTKLKFSSDNGAHEVNFKFYDAIERQYSIVGFILSKEGKLLIINEKEKRVEADQWNTQYLSNMLRGWIKNYSLVDFVS